MSADRAYICHAIPHAVAVAAVPIIITIYQVLRDASLLGGDSSGSGSGSGGRVIRHFFLFERENIGCTMTVKMFK